MYATHRGGPRRCSRYSYSYKSGSRPWYCRRVVSHYRLVTSAPYLRGVQPAAELSHEALIGR
eukprot:scaffold213846_cov51-Prasinocladus_malaysianus.AAC.1